MSPGQRLFLAATLTPLVATIGMLIPVGTDQALDFISSLGLLPIVYYFTLIVTGVVGLPLYLLGRRLKLVRWWSSAISGFAVGVTADLLMRLPNLPEIQEPARLGLIGAVSGLAFWFLIGRPSASA